MWPRAAPGLATSARRCDIDRPRRKHVDVDLHRAVGHLGDKGGVQDPQALAGVAQLLAHGPDRHGGDDSAMRQGSKVPRLVRSSAS